MKRGGPVSAHETISGMFGNRLSSRSKGFIRAEVTVVFLRLDVQ